MDLKEKLKEILKKNYGITSDAELLEELDDMESVDLGIFVTQIDTEKTSYCKSIVDNLLSAEKEIYQSSERSGGMIGAVNMNMYSATAVRYSAEFFEFTDY